MQHEFQRVAIVNRGEAAMRFIHAVREFNQERGAALRTIALFTDPDRRAMFVREADEAVSLGAAQIVDPRTNHLKSSYVDYGVLERALAASRAEAAWVGWGFVAEHAQFADLCRDMGIVFIGPDGDVMRQLGDKISSKRLAEQARIPIALWSGGPVDTLDDAWHHAAQQLYAHGCTGFLIALTPVGQQNRDVSGIVRRHSASGVIITQSPTGTAMTPQGFQELRRWFERLVSLPPAEQERALDEMAASDPERCGELRRLLSEVLAAAMKPAPRARKKRTRTRAVR